MNNWRLLLLAVVVVVQPIGSFTESNLIDGRECCERSEDARLYGYRKAEERFSLDGNRGNRRTTNQDRLISRTLNGIREERHYETIRSPMLISSNSLGRNERRISPELSRTIEHRLDSDQKRHQDIFARSRETREDQNRNRDESRNILGQNKRVSRQSRNRGTSDASRTVRLTRDAEMRFAERESRNTISRLQIRTIRSNEERRFAQNRERTFHTREREDLARSDIRRDSRPSSPVRSDSLIQRNDNRERTVFDRRTKEDGPELRSSHFSDSRINEVRAIREQRTNEQNRINSRDYRDVKAELRSVQRDPELRDRVSAVRRDTRNNQRTDERKQRDESRRSLNTEDQRMDSRKIRATRDLDTTKANDERMERRSLSGERLSMHRVPRETRLSRSSERNTRDERASRIRDIRDQRVNERRQERDTNRASRDRTESRQERRSITSRMDIRESTQEIMQQRQVRYNVEQRDQVHSVSRRKQRQESHRNIRESPEEQRLQREDSRRSTERTSPLREVRDSSERESRMDARESSERRQQDSNLSRYRISNSMLLRDRMVRDTERLQETLRAVSTSRNEINFRNLDSRSRQDIRDNQRSDLRVQVERSMERTLRTERRNNVRDTSRIPEDTRVIVRDERRPTRDQDRTIEQRVTRNVATLQRLDTRRSLGIERSREVRENGDRDRTNKIVIRVNVTPQRLDTQRSQSTERTRLERVVRDRDVNERGNRDRTVQRVARNVVTPQRLDTRSSSRFESIRLERLVRNRAEVKDNDRRDMQREKRDADRTRITLSRRSSENVFAEGRQDRDSRTVRMTRSRSEVRAEKILSDRRQENRDTIRDSRNDRGEVRSERMVEERRQNRDSQNVREIREDSRRQRDAARDSRERSLQRETRGSTDRLTELSREPVARNERIRKNEREVRSDRSDARRESRSALRANNVLNMKRMDRTENRSAKDGIRDETIRKNDALILQNTIAKESDKPLFSNWQMVFYTLQGVYLCGLLVQMITEKAHETKKRAYNWWSSPMNLIKMD